MRNHEPTYSMAERPLDLEIRHLRLIVGVADLGSLTRAAERLNLTQSALSHQLIEIESRLRTQLFHRVGRKMVLTQAGSRVLDAARRVLGDLVATEEDLRMLASDRAGIIRLTTECYTCYHWLPPLLKDFQTRYPTVEISIDVESTSHPIAALLKGQLDLAIMSSEIEDSRLDTTALFEDELVLIVAPDHPLARRDYIRPRDLVEETMLTYSELELNQLFRDVLQPAGIVPKRHLKVRLTEAMIEMVRARLGVTSLARWAVAPHLKQGLVKGVPITAKGLHRLWKGVTLQSSRQPAWLSDFLTLVIREGRRLAHGRYPAAATIAR